MLRYEDDYPPEFTGVPIEPYRGPLITTRRTGVANALTLHYVGGQPASSEANSNILAAYQQALDEGQQVERWAGWGAGFPTIVWMITICAFMISPWSLLFVPWVSPLFAALVALGLFNTFRSIKHIHRASTPRTVIGFTVVAIGLDLPIILMLGSLLFYWLQSVFAS